MTLDLTEDKNKTIFYVKKKHDYKTVAYSVVRIKRCRFKFETISGKKHAEEHFIEEFNEYIRYDFQRTPCIQITIMLSKSPCWSCRENLEAFFEDLTKKGAKILFILRIANLYHGDHDGGEIFIIENLAQWICHLRRENIVNNLDIQPISVSNELPNYTPQDLVDKNGWCEIVEERKEADTEIANIVERINDLDHFDPKLITLGIINLKKRADEKRLFYKSTSRDRDKLKFVGIAQVHVNAINTVGRTKTKIFKPIVEKTNDEVCCYNFEKLLSQPDEIPTSWRIKSTEIILVLTHFPCEKCAQKIPEVILESKTQLICKDNLRLILRLANADHNDIKPIYDWLSQYYDGEGFRIELQAISVKTELGQVNCEKNATKAKQSEWKISKKQRPGLDKETNLTVETINEHLLDIILAEMLNNLDLL